MLVLPELLALPIAAIDELRRTNALHIAIRWPAAHRLKNPGAYSIEPTPDLGVFEVIHPTDWHQRFDVQAWPFVPGKSYLVGELKVVEGRAGHSYATSTPVASLRCVTVEPVKPALPTTATPDLDNVPWHWAFTIESFRELEGALGRIRPA